MTSVQVAPLRESGGDAQDGRFWTPTYAVWALVGVGIALRAWVVSGGYFYWDDYIFQGRAAKLPLGAEYLLHPHDGHFMPGAFLLQWPLTRIWPMDYTPLAVILVLGQAAVVVLFARLVLALWPGRWLALVPTCIVALTPLTLPTNTWWAAALNGIPLQLSLVTMLMAGVTWARTGRTRGLWWSLAGWLVLLSFSEKLLIVPFVAFAAVPLVRPLMRPRAAWTDAARRLRAPLLAAAGVVASYVFAYAQVVGKVPSSDATASQVSSLLGRGLVTTVATGTAGGPLEWLPIGFGSAIGQPPVWLVVVSCELLAVLVIWSSAVSHVARWTWLWAGAYVLGDLALLATGRINAFVDPVIVQGMRYTADAAVPIALALGAGMAAIGPSVGRALRRHGGSPGRRASGPGVAPVLIVTAIAILSVVSTASYRSLWVDNPSREYIANAAHDLSDAAAGPMLVDQPVPVDVLYGLAFPYNQASWVLGPLRDSPGFGDPTSLLRLIDDTGHLRPALVEGPGAQPGPVPGCGWKVERGRDIPLASSIIPFAHTVRVGYIATDAGTMSLALGDGPSRPVTVVRGLGDVVVTLEGGGDVLRVRDLSPGVVLCTDDVRVGKPVVVRP